MLPLLRVKTGLEPRKAPHRFSLPAFHDCIELLGAPLSVGLVPVVSFDRIVVRWMLALHHDDPIGPRCVVVRFLDHVMILLHFDFSVALVETGLESLPTPHRFQLDDDRLEAVDPLPILGDPDCDHV